LRAATFTAGPEGASGATSTAISEGETEESIIFFFLSRLVNEGDNGRLRVSAVLVAFSSQSLSLALEQMGSL
jgi:hypothetical protein